MNQVLLIFSGKASRLCDLLLTGKCLSHCQAGGSPVASNRRIFIYTDMTEPAQKQPPQTSPMRRDHMANERTFLAWIRTSIGIMAFGFVIEKFALFLKHLQFFFKDAQPPSSGQYSSLVGIILVALGALMGLLAFIRYKEVEKEINEDSYQPSILLDILLTLGILMICIFLVFYMIRAL